MESLSNIDHFDSFVIISGAGYKYIGESQESNIFKDKNCKPNIGATCALELAKNNYSILILSRTEEKLKRIKLSIDELYPDNELSYKAIDLLNENEVEKINNLIPENKSIHLVHCMGLSAGAYQLPDDNPYLPVEDTPINLPTLEFESVVKSLLLLVQNLLPRFSRQKDTRIIVVSSMSGIRSFPWGYSHTSAKAGLHHATRALTLELNKKNIFVSEINPGIVNTGMYDPPVVRNAVVEVAKTFGYSYSKSDFPQMEPNEVSKAVVFCLTAESHVLQINIVPKGQYTNICS